MPLPRAGVTRALRTALRIAPFAALLATASAFGQPHRAAAQPLPTPVVDRGVAVVQCTGDHDRGGTRVQAAIVDLGAGAQHRDAVLTVAHGLPSTPDAVRRDCYVLAERDRQHAIAAVWLGGGSGYAGDWAVLLLDRRLRGDAVVRLNARTVSAADIPQLAAARAAIRLLHGAGNPDCEVRHTKWLSRRDIAAGVFAHSCEGWSGLSGSPIVLPQELGSSLVGIHLGQLTSAGDDGDTGGEPVQLLSLALGFDSAILAALAEAAVQAARR